MRPLSFRSTSRSPWLLAAIALSLLFTPYGASADDDDGDELCEDPAYAESYACREIIIEQGEGFDEARLVARYGMRSIGRIPELSLVWMEAPLGTDVPTLEELLEEEPGVEEAERNDDFRPPECRQLNDVILELGAGGRAAMHAQPAIDAMRARGVAYRSAGRAVVVAVLDTGAVSSHEALAPALLPGMDFVIGAASAEDRGNGVDDDLDGEIDEGFGHGTAVAGLIRLVAPGAYILPVRVLDDECRGSAFRLAAAIVRAVDAGARVLNLSLGSRSKNGVIEKALEYAREHDVVVVSAAGHVTSEHNQVAFPASEDDVLAVTAVDDLLVVPDWAIAGRKVDLVAPGEGLIAPWRHGYAQLSGTSFSAALVSGAMAAARAAHPHLRANEIIALVQSTAIDVRPFNLPSLASEIGAGVPDLPALIQGSFDPVWPRHPGPRLRRTTTGAGAAVEVAAERVERAEDAGDEP